MKQGIKDFRDLKIWQRAMDLVPLVYRAVRGFPRAETFALACQVRRAVVSIPANVAEGHARQHTKEFLQHLSIARGSSAELWTLLLVARQLGYLHSEQLGEIESLLEEVRRLLGGLINRLQAKP